MADDSSLLFIVLPLSILATLIAIVILVPLLCRQYCYTCWNDIFCYECCRSTAFCVDCCADCGCDCPMGPVVEDYPKPGRYPSGHYMVTPHDIHAQHRRGKYGRRNQQQQQQQLVPVVFQEQPQQQQHTNGWPTQPFAGTKSRWALENEAVWQHDVEAQQHNRNNTWLENKNALLPDEQQQQDFGETIPSEPRPTPITRPPEPQPPDNSNTNATYYEQPISAQQQGYNPAQYDNPPQDSLSSNEVSLPMMSREPSFSPRPRPDVYVPQPQMHAPGIPLMNQSETSSSNPPTPPKPDYDNHNVNEHRMKHQQTQSGVGGVVPSGWTYEPMGAHQQPSSTQIDYNRFGGVIVEQGLYLGSGFDHRQVLATSTTRVTTHKEKKVVSTHRQIQAK